MTLLDHVVMPRRLRPFFWAEVPWRASYSKVLSSQ